MKKSQKTQEAAHRGAPSVQDLDDDADRDGLPPLPQHQAPQGPAVGVQLQAHGAGRDHLHHGALPLEQHAWALLGLLPRLGVHQADKPGHAALLPGRVRVQSDLQRSPAVDVLKVGRLVMQTRAEYRPPAMESGVHQNSQSGPAALAPGLLTCAS